MQHNLVEMVLTCSSWQEAQRLADGLLAKELVKSIETFDVKHRYWWEGHPHSTRQVRLIVLGQPKRFNEIKSFAARLQQTPTTQVLLTELI